MSKIKLPRTVLEDAGGPLIVHHVTTGAKVEISRSKLDRWCIEQLRSEMLAPIASPPKKA